MALDFFRVSRGLDIQSDDLSSNVQVLFGSGAPGGDSGEQDAAPIGSIFMRTDTTTDELQMYWKHTTGGGTSDWSQSASRSLVDAVTSGISWREPVVTHASRNFADITAVETELNNTTTFSITGVDTTNEQFQISGDQTTAFPSGEEFVVQGSTGNDGLYSVSSSAYDSGTDTTTITVNEDVTDSTADGTITNGVLGGVATNTLADGDRILVSDLDTGNENIYTVNGTPGSGATLTETSNSATDGDAVFVQEGTHAEQQWLYNGTSWILILGANQASEIGNIRDFIGKDSSGTEFPSYPSNDIVTDGSNLEYEIGTLDDAMGTLTFSTPNVLTDYSDTFGSSSSPGTAASSDITTNFQAIDDQFGDGALTSFGSNYALSDELNWNTNGTLTLTSAFDEINEAIGDRTYTNNYLLTDGETLATSLDTIDTEFGDINTGASYTSGGLITTSTIASNDLQQNLDTLNVEAGRVQTQTDTFTFTGISSQTDIDSIATADFNNIVWHVQYKDGTGNRLSYMVHALSDGTTTDFTTYGKLRTGSSIGDTGDTVTLDGSGNIVFRISPTNTLDVTIKRISLSKLA